jgi:sterol desaturase/sphingolipid hydroxylase (fatty acid hydroxylase superfamily)
MQDRPMLATLRAAGALALSGGAFTSPVWLYRMDFVLYPLLAAGIIATQCRGIQWAALALAGVVLFTFVEYWTHRIVLHRFLFHGSHERHHSHPREYVVFPIWYTPAIFAGFFVVLPLPVFAGFVIGYCWFLIWHHVLHHVDLTRWPRPAQHYALWHLAHHRRDDCNFGITTNLWDYVFGSYRRVP